VKIAVLGTGVVGRTLSGKLAELGHETVVGTRDPGALLARTDPDAMGNPPFCQWHDEHPAVRIAPFSEAAAHGELIFNATSGVGSMEALRQADGDNLANKIIVDVANPLDFSRGMPPSLSVCNTDSLAEEIQRTFPSARVVKSLNTVTALLMVDAGLVDGGEHTMFVSGNDAGAKAKVATILRDWFGWKHVLDLGDITGARAMEMYLPLWLRTLSLRGNPMFNIAVVG
jgi:8-hydroxy-5-deazaflavin:NADPH oxidoreductase